MEGVRGLRLDVFLSEYLVQCVCHCTAYCTMVDSLGADEISACRAMHYWEDVDTWTRGLFSEFGLHACYNSRLFLMIPAHEYKKEQRSDDPDLYQLGFFVHHKVFYTVSTSSMHIHWLADQGFCWGKAQIEGNLRNLRSSYRLV